MEYMPVVVGADYLEGYKVKLLFDNGEERVVDCEKWLNGEIFEPLKNPNNFKNFFVDGWTISWPNGADIAPETLYRGSSPV